MQKRSLVSFSLIWLPFHFLCLDCTCVFPPPLLYPLPWLPFCVHVVYIYTIPFSSLSQRLLPSLRTLSCSWNLRKLCNFILSATIYNKWMFFWICLPVWKSAFRSPFHIFCNSQEHKSTSIPQVLVGLFRGCLQMYQKICEPKKSIAI